MTSHLDDQLLSDLVDQGLDAPARVRAEAHLSACDICSSRLQRIAMLVTEASALPRAMPTPPNEWERVRKRLPARATHTAPASPWWMRRSALLAAGLALVIASSVVTALIVRNGPDVALESNAISPTAGVFIPRFAALEDEYLTVARDLERQLAERKHTLAPETVAAVERSLRTIDAAIAEAREALARDPGSETLTRLLVAGHGQKIELLRHAARLATQS
jgi:anti-sigma factor RsiW